MNADETLPKGKGFPWMGVVFVLFLIAGALLLLSATVISEPRPSERIVAWRKAHYLHLMLNRYIDEFGAPPAGDHAAIMAALRGQNPRQTVLVDEPEKFFNANGEFLDPWKHPYHIDVSNPEAVTVYSFGKNGVDEGGAVGSDDVVSWR